MRKVDGDSAFEERSPQWRHLLTLADRIRGNKGSLDRSSLHVIRHFAVPTSDIIQQTVQGRARNRHREVVDLNPVKLTQRHFDRTVSKLLKVEHRLVTQQLAYNDVLQAPQLNVGFRQEVAAAARWIIHAVHLGFTHQS